jgi:hypothetical protein
MSLIRVTGKVIARVFNSEGKLIQESINHNIVTEQGDALIADIISNTNARQKLDNSHGYIVVGTGYTGASNKTQTWVLTAVGNAQPMDSTYPKLQGTWGNTGQNVVVYQSTYAQGALNAVGINEAALVTAFAQASSTSCLAYAQVTPATTVSPSDSLQVIWQISFQGS